jgi:hypothetical protein
MDSIFRLSADGVRAETLSELELGKHGTSSNQEICSVFKK